MAIVMSNEPLLINQMTAISDNICYVFISNDSVWLSKGSQIIHN